jgi:hypothetical protein
LQAYRQLGLSCSSSSGDGSKGEKGEFHYCLWVCILQRKQKRPDVKKVRIFGGDGNATRSFSCEIQTGNGTNYVSLFQTTKRWQGVKVLTPSEISWIFCGEVKAKLLVESISSTHKLNVGYDFHI